MSGVLIVPNPFANAVTATGAQLDANFNTVTAYINDPTNRNNYAADAGSATNTIALTFSPPVVGGYSAGLQITFKATNGNTGAVVLNANGLGNVNLFSPAGVALAGGEITSGQEIIAVHDGTRFQMVSQPANAIAASAATVSQALSNAFFVTPGRMQNHPGVAKAWGVFVGTNTGTITMLGGFNVTNAVRVGTGSYTINFATPMANTAYAIVGMASTGFTQERDGTRLAGSAMIVTFTSGSQIDSTFVQFIAFGSQ